MLSRRAARSHTAAGSSAPDCLCGQSRTCLSLQVLQSVARQTVSAVSRAPHCLCKCCGQSRARLSLRVPYSRPAPPRTAVRVVRLVLGSRGAYWPARRVGAPWRCRRRGWRSCGRASRSSTTQTAGSTRRAPVRQRTQLTPAAQRVSSAACRRAATAAQGCMRTLIHSTVGAVHSRDTRERRVKAADALASVGQAPTSEQRCRGRAGGAAAAVGPRVPRRALGGPARGALARHGLAARRPGQRLPRRRLRLAHHPRVPG